MVAGGDADIAAESTRHSPPIQAAVWCVCVCVCGTSHGNIVFGTSRHDLTGDMVGTVRYDSGLILQEASGYASLIRDEP